MKDDFKPARPEPAFVPVQNDPQPNSSQEQTPELGKFAAANQAPGSELPTPPPDIPHQSPISPKGKNWHPRTLWRHFQRLPKKQQIIIAVTVAFVLLGTSAAAYFLLKPEPAPPPPPPPVVKEEPKPTTLASPLTGVQVKPELARLPTTGVMIENSPDARPQSGLYDAGVVYEAIAEGGITRFLALFQESKPEYIGPVRSVRPYYLDFLAPFDAPIAHAGGSGAALAQVRAEGFKDLEAFQNPAYYQRVSSRYAPHNLYTGRTRLLQLQKSKGWTSSKFTGFTRKEEKKATNQNAKKIDFSISSFYYNPHFDYDGKTNSYKRTMAGVPHTDEKSKKQINPKVVVALVMSHHYAGIYSVYGVTGKGTAFVFQDGTVTKGTWEKKARKNQFVFKTAKGEKLGLNPGQTWVSIVSSPGAVTYKP